jgi:hypothetical protein
VQHYLNPEAEHCLDWFHVTMRFTVMGQYAKGLDTTQENRQEILKLLESVKHYLWHGNVARARDRIEDIHCFLDNEELTGENNRKLRKTLDEFDTYVVVNEALIPNYGELWRNEESIATGFVESAVFFLPACAFPPIVTAYPRLLDALAKHRSEPVNENRIDHLSDQPMASLPFTPVFNALLIRGVDLSPTLASMKSHQ